MKNKAHIIKLYPTEKQKSFFNQSCGVARFGYNWALQRWKELYEQGEKPSAYSLIKELNKIKREQYSWMYDVGKCTTQYAIHNLEDGFKKFFKKKCKYPKFKKKGIKDSFVAVENCNGFKQKDYKIWIPRLGWVKCAENLRFEGKVLSVTIKRIAETWFASINIETYDKDIPTCESQTVIGVDLGIKSMLTLSNGKNIENPKPLHKNIKRLKRLQRRFSKKKKGSSNQKRAQVKLARLHLKISNIRKNSIHNATKYLVDNFDKIVIEDLNVLGMTKNRKLAMSLNDVSFGEIRRQLEYKCKWYGKELVIVDRFFPSSKLCSGCGNKKDNLKLSERTYICECCGLEIDRDINAAINLANYSPTQKSWESYASGVRSSDLEISCSLTLNEEVNLNCLTH